MRSVSSVLAVRTNRSAKQFARGQRGGIFTLSILALARRYAPMFEDPANRGGADPVAELEQFALHALISPGRILSGQPFDQAAMVGVDARAAVGVRVGPFLGDQSAVPAQDGGRSDQAVTAQARG
jgi:hypothetical protein